jgi:hypothetical protein
MQAGRAKTLLNAAFVRGMSRVCKKNGQGDCVPLPEASLPLWGGTVLARNRGYFFGAGAAGAAGAGAAFFSAGAAFFAATTLEAVPSA